MPFREGRRVGANFFDAFLKRRLAWSRIRSVDLLDDTDAGSFGQIANKLFDYLRALDDFAACTLLADGHVQVGLEHTRII